MVRRTTTAAKSKHIILPRPVWLVLCLVVLACASSPDLRSQPRLDVRSLPTAPKLFDLRIANNAGFDVGVAGANVIWDFTGLQPRGDITDIVQISYLPPSAVPSAAASLYPSAQVVVRTGNSYEFFRTAGSVFRSLGVWTTTSALTSGTANPYDTRPVEITFGGEHVDQYRAVITITSPPQTRQRAGNHRFVYDGFGTLRLPSGIVSGVARTRTTTSTSDTTRITSPQPRIIVTTTDIDLYRWAPVNSDATLLMAATTSVRVTDNGVQTSFTTSREIMFRDTIPAVSSVNDLDHESVLLFPNPITANHEVVVAGIDVDIESVHVIDAQGGTTPLRFTRNGTSSFGVTVEGLASGSYALVLRSRNGVLRKRLVVLE